MLRYVLEPGLAQRPGDISSEKPQKKQREETQSPEEILEAFRATTIGAEQEVQTCFGSRRTVYADYTASGRASTLVEDFVRDKVLPFYGNTHTLTTATARQTTYIRAEAREVIRHHLNASHEDAVIFAGNGSTGAAHLLVQTLQRANFALRRAGAEGSVQAAGQDDQLKDMHYREDRWGGGECTLCGVRVKSAAIYMAHRHTEAHRAKLRVADESGTGGHPVPEERPALRFRRVVVVVDTVLHHSSSLPFRELLPRHPLSGPPSLEGFSGSSFRSGGSSSSTNAGSTGGPLEVEVELSCVPVNPSTGLMDEDDFRRRLESLRSWRTAERELVVICMLAAASNVTGLCADVPKVTAMARTALPGAVVCWDFAASAGHQACDLNPPGEALATVDAAFFSPHKLWGGPGSVGVLAVKKELLCNAVPAVAGGGVVFYVTDKGHSYIQNSEEREEAGTPNIVGCIRAGLVHHLLDQMPPGIIRARESALLQKVTKAWSGHPRIDILGPQGADGTERTGVVSFMLRYGNDSAGLYLHYNYVAAVLNDVFGVQSRGGCACAGPYAQWLLGMDLERSEDFEKCLAHTAQEVLRPGFVRAGVHWAMSEEDIEVLIAAVLWVADNGWRLLAAYTFDRETGEWLHRMDTPERRRIWLSAIRPPQAADKNPIAELESSLGIGGPISAVGAAPRGAKALVVAADFVLREAYSSSQVSLAFSKWPMLDPVYAHLLWFALPADAAHSLRSDRPDQPQLVPGEGIFLSTEVQSVRPTNSVMDARVANGAKALEAGSVEQVNELPHVEGGGEDDGFMIELPVEDDEPQEKVKADTGPRFSRRSTHPSIPKPLRGLVGKAIGDFGMIKDGDRLLVGVSGGKDSLCVLHVLLALQKSAPIKFTIAAANIDPMTPEYNPAPLDAYMKAIGVEFFRLQKPIIEMAKTHIDPKRPSICSFCSRMKRGMLYSCMREKNYNVLVLGQHLDDFAESFFMSAIHNGLLRTMKANYWVTQEDVRVCRPLIYVREREMAIFAKENQLPIINDNCPACFAAPKERHKMKLLLSGLEFDYPALFSILLRTMKPLYSLETADKSESLKMGGGGGGGEDDDAEPSRPHGVSKATARRRKADAAEEDAGAEEALTACGAAAGVAGDGGCCSIPEAIPEWVEPVEESSAAPPSVSSSPPPDTALIAAASFAAGAVAASMLAVLAARLTSRS